MILETQIALVTGPANGIGAASSFAFAKAGASVVCADIDMEGAQRSAEQLRKLGLSSMELQADCSQVSDIEDMLDRIIDTQDRLDIILNNAGITRQADIMDITENEWDRIHQLNAKGCLLLPARCSSAYDFSRGRKDYKYGFGGRPWFYKYDQCRLRG